MGAGAKRKTDEQKEIDKKIRDERNLSIGQNLLTIRKNKGYTRSQLAKLIGNDGYNRSAITNIEAGRRPISDALLKDWLRVCDAQMEVIFISKKII